MRPQTIKIAMLVKLATPYNTHAGIKAERESVHGKKHPIYTATGDTPSVASGAGDKYYADRDTALATTRESNELFKGTNKLQREQAMQDALAADMFNNLRAQALTGTRPSARDRINPMDRAAVSSKLPMDVPMPDSGGYITTVDPAQLGRDYDKYQKSQMSPYTTTMQVLMQRLGLAK